MEHTVLHLDCQVIHIDQAGGGWRLTIRR
jgi:hypothetical protein